MEATQVPHDGRVAVGAVPPALLYAALGHHE